MYIALKGQEGEGIMRENEQELVSIHAITVAM
jgi:hypothetical protein